ncbi:unnamed protein product, partial [Ectocarpus sp. 12 AP-2014]
RRGNQLYWVTEGGMNPRPASGMRKSCCECGRKKRKCDGLMPCRCVPFARHGAFEAETWLSGGDWTVYLRSSSTAAVLQKPVGVHPSSTPAFQSVHDTRPPVRPTALLEKDVTQQSTLSCALLRPLYVPGKNAVASLGGRRCVDSGSRCVYEKRRCHLPRPHH